MMVSWAQLVWSHMNVVATFSQESPPDELLQKIPAIKVLFCGEAGDFL